MSKIKMRTISGLREDAGVSVERMAEDFGVTVGTVYNWQNDQLRLTGEKIKEICEYFGITANDFLGLH